MPDANIHTGFENTVQDQNVTWNHGSTYVPNYFTSANGVPIFPQFPPASQSIPIFPQFPPAVNFSSHSNIAMYPGRQNFHQYTPVGKHNTHILIVHLRKNKSSYKFFFHISF
ncbi:unnamed protein product [Trifolium pratense]|uniref:Uncharacterized protein n=1 Tax=Trifolium pratense TaxID=57577 RepID=A0ACB0KE38_TRIPR|nr:unnamed protein product [Trifolium pratense]